MRKTRFIGFSALWVSAALGSLGLHAARQGAAGKAAQRGAGHAGEIMDSKCGIGGTHAEEMRRTSSATAKDCTLLCAKNNGSFVLYDPATKKVYQLDDQKKPAAFAGQKVKISGSYDEPSNTILIESIEPN